MKRTLTTILTTIFFFGFVLGQNSPVKTRSSSELPDFSKKSLNTKNRVELYPNPTTDYLTVTIDQFSLKDVKFELYNIIGNSIGVDVDKIGRGKYKINVEKYTPGYYLLVIRDPVTRYTKAYKFQKK
jgi:hypothetical protein